MIECSPQKASCLVALFVVIAVYYIFAETNLFTKDLNTFEKDVPKCIPIFNEANGMIAKEINSTKRILKNPEVYSNISAKCEKAIECAESFGSPMKSYYLDGKYNPCMFFAFYHGYFSSCADRLIGKVGDQIPCIETVFQESFHNKTEKCEAYKNAQPCIVRAILNACDVMPEEGKMRKKQTKKDFYADEIYNLVPALCMDY